MIQVTRISSKDAVAGTECIHCGEPKNPGALFCIRCDKYQDWRRFLPVSSSVLSALTALLVIIASYVIPALQTMFVNKDAVVVVSSASNWKIRRAGSDSIELCKISDDDMTLATCPATVIRDFFFYNTGKSTAGIRGADLRIFDKDKLVYTIASPSLSGIVLKPDNTEVVELAINQSTVDFSGFESANPRCELLIQIKSPLSDDDHDKSFDCIHYFRRVCESWNVQSPQTEEDQNAIKVSEHCWQSIGTRIKQ